MSRPLALARSGVDRTAHRRDDPGWLGAAWHDPRTRVLVVDQDGRARVEDDALVLLPPAGAPAGEPMLLGEAAGTAYFAVTGPLSAGPTATLRDVGAVLGDRDAGLLTHAVALSNWHLAHPRCARCGEPTIAASAGHLRRCPADGSEHYPRVDPAVIMLVTDQTDRVVLGRAPTWAPGRHSVLAGFVEPGESLEQAVVREVFEEVGLVVRDVRYVGSQPWPFPSSLMVGFTASAPGVALRLDPKELAEAAWFTRSELRTAVAAARLTLPSAVSIARRLVDDWLARAEPG